MSKALSEMLIKSPTAFTQSRGFRIFMEPFIPYLRTHPDTQRVEITPETKYLYNFTLEALLTSKGVSNEDIWTVMRVNGIENSQRLDPTITYLLIPTPNQLSEFKGIYKNRLDKG